MEKVNGRTELEMTDSMVSRVEQIDNAAYEACCKFLGIYEEEREEKFPWDMEILAAVINAIIDVLLKYKRSVCYPYIEYEGQIEDEKPSFCQLEDCGCGQCVRDNVYE